MDEQRMSSLEGEVHDGIDVIVKLTQFSGGEDGVKTLIDKEIKRLRKKLSEHVDTWNAMQCCAAKMSAIGKLKGNLKSSENLKTDTIDDLLRVIQDLKNKCLSHNHIDSPSSKTFDDMASMFSKLCEHKKSLDTNKSNSPTTLLNNLCTGLEKFLGYEKGNYTGEGIVYSDLDRLCDGVMAFLHGVLKDVHDKQPYKAGKESHLKSVVDALHSKLCSGHKGFKEVIEKVAAGVGGYNREVERSNEDVKTIITTMQGNMESLQKQVSEILKDHSDAGTRKEFSEQDVKTAMETMSSKVEAAKKHAGAFCTDITNAHNNIAQFNNNCRNTVETAHRIITHESAIVHRISERASEDFWSMEKEISITLKKVGQDVNKELRKKISSLVKQLKSLVERIRDRLNEISIKLWDYVKNLQEWMNEVKKIVAPAIGQCDSILAEAKGYDGSRKQTIKHEAVKLQEWKHKLDDYINNTVRPSIKSLANAAHEAVKSLNTELKKDLERMKLAISGILDPLVSRSVTFSERCVSTKYVLTQAIEQVEVQLTNLQSTSNVDGVTMKFLTALKKSPLNCVKTYFTALDEKVMEPLKTVMQRIGDGIRRGVQQVKMDVLGGEVNAAKLQLTELQHVVKNPQTVANLVTLTSELKTYGMTISVHELNLNSHTGAIQAVTNKLTTSKPTVTISEATDLLTSLGAIAQAISDHAKQVVEKVIEAIQSKIKGEVNVVASAIKARVNRIKESINESTKDECVQYSEAGPKADGLAKLVSEFDIHINKALGRLQKNVDTVAFKKNGWTSDMKVDDTLEAYAKHRKGKVETSLGDITLYASEGFDVNATTRALNDLSGNIIKYLEDLMTTVSDAGGNIHSRLITLRDIKIDIHLNAIKSRLHKLHNEMADAIELTNSFITREADEAGQATITALETFVDNQIENTKTQLTTRARRNYVTSVKALLQAFAAKVTQELQPLPAAIDEDLRIGFKGFMRKVQGEFNGNETSDVNIKRLQNGYDLQSLCNGFERFYAPLHTYLLAEVKRLHKEECEKNQKTTTEEAHYSDKLTAIYSALTALTSHIHSTNRYDYQLPSKLTAVQSAINALTPNGFSNPNTAILDGLTEGLRKFVEQLNKAYISRYDGATAIKEWEADGPKKEDGSDNKILTQDGRNGAKVFLTCVRTLFNELYNVYYHGGHKWRSQEIQGKGNETKYKEFLHNSGYDVVNLITKDNTGWNVSIRLAKAFKKHQEFSEYPDKFNSVNDCMDHFSKHQGLLSRLFDHLEQYYQVCQHIHIPSPKSPSNIYEMLEWLSGLRYNPMYEKLQGHFTKIFTALQKQYNLPSAELPAALHPRMSDTIQSPLKPSHLIDALGRSCAYAQDSLIAILGHGHEGGRYAVEFNTNTDNLDYPSSPAKCFDLLLEISSRVYNQMRFLYSQCQNGPSRGGWADCWYGRGVAGSSWNCNTLQCPDQPYNQIGEQKHNQTCSQKCNQTVECGLKSPLQSFLEDGLQGFLPHTLTKLGCGVECSVASHTKNGEFLKKVLHSFCGQEKSHLSKFCGIVNCLMQRPPQTLGDMFAFYYGYLENWEGGDKGKDTLSKKHKHDAFEKAVKEACFGSTFEFNLISIFESTRHSGKHITHEKGDLFRIVQCPYSLEDTCGFFVSSLSFYIYNMYSECFRSFYLSCVVYITEAFYNMLCQLRDECCTNCTSPASKCNGNVCANECKLTVPEPNYKNHNHHKDCKSIAQCPLTLPTLTKYGLMFNSAYRLTGEGKESRHKRTCKDFCDALKNVLNNKKADEYVLAQLVFNKIPSFLWKIREPFSYLLLALWSLSLLYLLHILVVRLDVLRIRSHLRSPSSHRIAAQSLLAAARVKALANVKYFSP
ncbi:hypothetical protein, conserved [Babesia ovata]|uniref:C3H1-type domain-containing protein n=1 Tax=Babesia ovata TaxID=189622 RepID=A0A2H6KJ37_9APIC|nr:uncharacterized protein BOVATA_045000 [Babesia ovata]GBE63007.1 hypothetical protein, conserved [Babesia ovata]